MKLKELQRLIFAVILIPMPSKDWLDLKYSKLTPNKVKLEKAISVDVNSSASPLFYTFKDLLQIDSIEVTGSVMIQKSIKVDLDDSYFQIGVIYEGDFKPNSFTKMFLPEWMKMLLKVGGEHGLDKINFYGISHTPNNKVKVQKVRGLQLSFESSALLKKSGDFFLKKNIDKNKKVLGLWLRSDGDDSQAKFSTTIKSIKVFTHN